MRVILGLLGNAEDGEGLVGVDQIADVVVDDGGAGRIHECLDGAEHLSTLDQIAGARDIHSFEEGWIANVRRMGRGCMEDDTGLDLLEDGHDFRPGGNVAIVV